MINFCFATALLIFVTAIAILCYRQWRIKNFRYIIQLGEYEEEQYEVDPADCSPEKHPEFVTGINKNGFVTTSVKAFAGVFSYTEKELFLSKYRRMDFPNVPVKFMKNNEAKAIIKT